MEIKTYKLLVEIAGESKVLNGPIVVRAGDMDTPILDVVVSQTDINGNNTPFNLINKKVYFECVNSDGFTFIDDGSVFNNLNIVSYEMGRFKYLIPSAAKGSRGKTNLAYFRFSEENADFESNTNVQSTGNFSFETVGDALSSGKGIEIFHADVKKMQIEVTNVKHDIEQVNNSFNLKQDKVFGSSVGNVVVWGNDGEIADVGIGSEDIIHGNRSIIDGLGEQLGRLTYNGEEIGGNVIEVTVTPPTDKREIWIKPIS